MSIQNLISKVGKVDNPNMWENPYKGTEAFKIQIEYLSEEHDKNSISEEFALLLNVPSLLWKNKVHFFIKWSLMWENTFYELDSS